MPTQRKARTKAEGRRPHYQSQRPVWNVYPVWELWPAPPHTLKKKTYGLRKKNRS